MAEIKSSDIANLRKKTGFPMMEVKFALIEAKGNEEKAIEILRKKGLKKSEKRADRKTVNGIIDSYVHAGRIGVLVEVLCETDFVARSDDFKNFTHEISLQVAASAPKYLEPKDIPAKEIEEEKKIYRGEAKSFGKSFNSAQDRPGDVIEKIVDGKLKSYYSDICLMQQPHFRDPKKTTSDLLNEITAKTGEKIVISRFVRFELSC